MHEKHTKNYTNEAKAKRHVKHLKGYCSKKRSMNYKNDKGLKAFFKEIKHGLSYVCVCCFRLLFERTVVVLTKELLHKIQRLGMSKYIALKEEFKYMKNHHLCKTCKPYLLKKQMPSLCHKNKLEIPEIPEVIKCLKPLEIQILAKRILFIKVRKLPKTRMEMMNDIVVNVPIDNEDIIQSVNALPRNSSNNGLVWCQLKRLLELKSAYKSEMVRPEKIIEALLWLKLHHPEYLDILINDIKSIDDLLGLNCENKNEASVDVDSSNDEKNSEEDDNDDNSADESVNVDSSNDENNAEEDTNYENSAESSPNDSNAKSFKNLKDLSDHDYNKTTAIFLEEPQNEVMVNSCKEPLTDTSIKPRVELAPGKGKIPTDYSRDEKMDITAFYHLHPRGEYGLNCERDKPLTALKYFCARIMSYVKNWATCMDYMYVSVLNAFILVVKLERNSKIMIK
jgi:hypothetical protein